ncbi:DsrE family protein [Leifsonia sp. SIMBA_070]|uniref:DsrE family protein n=1 Tax=Leifsonia sp. SIMBA_070 TaxID=3085810 RepID=UPI0039789677
MTEQTERGVVFQLSESGPEKIAAAVRNVNNVLASLGSETLIEVVAHGEGIVAVLAESSFASDINTIVAKGVVVSACANTLERKSLPESALVQGVTTVPSGIAELVQKQWAGWAYIRP